MNLQAAPEPALIVLQRRAGLRLGSFYKARRGTMLDQKLNSIGVYTHTHTYIYMRAEVPAQTSNGSFHHLFAANFIKPGTEAQ